jgi:hypothetical protein
MVLIDFTGIDYHWHYHLLSFGWQRDLYPRVKRPLLIHRPCRPPYLRRIFSMEPACIFRSFPPSSLRAEGISISSLKILLSRSTAPIFPGFDSRRGFYQPECELCLSRIYPDWSIAPVLYLKRIRMNLYMTGYETR